MPPHMLSALQKTLYLVSVVMETYFIDASFMMVLFEKVPTSQFLYKQYL